MSPKHTPEGHPVQVVTVASHRKFQLDVTALSKILLRDSIRDKPVMVLSIAGDFRKGKSFLLNHCLRFLQSNLDTNNWLGDPEKPLTGFSWRGGAERDTTGILMWSEPFVISTAKHGSVAVLLMDTQGCFDSEYTVKDSATVFALSTMTASVQVFNLMHNLQEDNLQVLDIFCEFGRLAMEEVHTKPFQRLIFLIRDWSFPYDHPYGFEGGRQLLEQVLEVNDQMPDQLQRVRRRVKDCFQELECFLSPHPGATVATNPNFDGRLTVYDPDFLESLKQLVPNLLKPDRLVVKQIGGRDLTGRALLEYFKAYAEIFAGDTMPEPKTMLEATAEANNLSAVAFIQDQYQKRLDEVCGAKRPFINNDLLQTQNIKIEAECLQQFDDIPKMGGLDFSHPYRAKLQRSMAHIYEQYQLLNSRKNMFVLVGVPCLLIFTSLLLSLLIRALESMALLTLANVCSTLSHILTAVIIAYFIARYTGNYPNFVVIVERGTELGWTVTSNYAAHHWLHSQVQGNANDKNAQTQHPVAQPQAGHNTNAGAAQIAAKS